MGVTKADVYHACVAYNKMVLSDRFIPKWADTFPVKPYQHQIDGVTKFVNANGRLMLGWEMGTGKTFGATSVIHAIQAKLTIIFAPASLTKQWEMEVKRTLPDRNVHLVKPDKMKNTLTDIDDDIFIVSYTRAKRFVETFVEMGNSPPEFIICDESHFLKNPKAQRTKAVKSLGKTTPMILLLSGTPIINRPVDLFTQLELLDPVTFNNWHKFTVRYCGGKQGPFGWIADGLTREKELHELLTDRMDRRLKADCLDIPSKVRTMIPVSIPKGKIDVIPESLQTWQEAALKLGLAKVNYAVAWINDFISATPSDKLVVFCKHQKVAELLQDMFNSSHVPEYASMFHGGTDMGRRDFIINRFKADPNNRVLIMTVGTGGTGLNLQFSKNILFVETTFSPTEILQAEDRIHRIGQQGSCNINYLTAVNTYDQKLFNLLIKKMSMTNKAVEGDFIDEDNVFKELQKVTNAVRVGELV